MTTFGVCITITIPYTASDASECAGSFGTSDIYSWKCPDGEGTFTNEVLVMDIPSDAFTHSMERDVLRASSVFNPSPVSFIEPDDPFVEKVANHILSRTEGFSDLQKAEAVLSFVQSSIAYTSDEKLYGTEEFWAFPVETLYLHRGDCEDTAVLFCSIASAMGLGCVLLDYEGHMAAGIQEGGCYLYCETATDYLTPIGSSDIGHEGEQPSVYFPGDDSDPKLVLNHVVAGYRNLIQRLAGA